MRVIFQDPPRQELEVATRVSGACAFFPGDTDVIFLANEVRLKTQSLSTGEVGR